MLKGRIIPCLDIKNGRVVKGMKFMNVIDVDDPEVLAEFYSKSGADELLFYDITATKENRKSSLEFVEKVGSKINIPFGVGGGIKTIEDFKNILDRGADKVSINSAAIKNPQLIKEASLKFGSKAVILSIDVKEIDKGEWNVFIEAGKTDTSIDAIDWAMEGVKLGAGELVVNSIDRDGIKKGYDIDLLKAITSKVSVPVIASGGAGKMEDFSQAILKTGVSGVLAASVFHYKEINIKELKKHMKEKGIEVEI